MGLHKLNLQGHVFLRKIQKMYFSQKNLNEKVMAPSEIDSISSRFNVLNMPISTTAPIDAKTHV
jgi:hypothetical protein